MTSWYAFSACSNSLNTNNISRIALFDFENKTDIPHTCVIKGDNKYLAIAAASIVAKVIRDDYMVKIDKFYPQYNWKSNKGYGSKEHIEKILSEGTTPHHRKSFLKKILS